MSDNRDNEDDTADWVPLDDVETHHENAEADGRAPTRARVAAIDCVAGHALDHSLTSAQKRLLRRDGSLAVVIEAPGPTWVKPLASAILEHGPWSIVEARDGTDARQHRATKGGEAIADALSKGGRCAGIAPIPKVHLPAALTGAADVYVRVVVTDDAIADTILSVTGRRPRDLPPAFCAGLDLLDIAAGIRVGDRADTAVARLRAASHARTIVDGDVASAPAFASLVGYGEAKDWGAALIEDLADWRLGKTRFEDILGRAILVSEPGLGKTTFVRSLAFATSLPLIVTSVSAWFSGLSMGNLDSVIKAVDEVFASARSVPGGHAIVFIDEIDAVPNRATLDSRNREWWLPVVTHILLTLDSAVSSANAGTIVIGATNHVEHLDKALLRRLGRVLRIGLPDADARAGILREHLHGEIAAADLEAVARLAHGMTGSDLAEAVKNARGKARGAKRRLEVSDLAAAIAPADTRSPEDRRIAAIHEAGHVVAQLAVGYSVESVSIVERGGSGGATIGRGLSGVPTRRQLDDHIVVLLSGRAAETVILGRATTGAGGAADSDLARAATTAVAIHTSYGLADSLLWRGPPAEALARMDPALRTVIDSDLVRLHARALALVGSRRPAVEAIAGRLLRDRFLSSDEIRRVVADAERSEIVAVEGTTGGLR